MNTEKSAQFFQKSLKHVPGGVHSPVRAFRSVGGTPLFIESGKGAKITDVDGNTFVDYCMAWGPMIFGHRDEETLGAVMEALHKGWSFGAAEKGSLQLAELITQNVPWVEKVRFVSSGTEAVMSALRISRAATGRQKILKFDGCYHGHADSMLVKAGSGLLDLATPDSAGVSTAVSSETIVAPLDNEEHVSQLFEKHGADIAAVIIEPLPANNGLLPQRKEFLSFLRKMTQKFGALLIFDEVISGFRVALGGMAQQEGIEPDLVTYGKIIGGGFPVGAYGGKKEYLDLVAPAGPVYQAGTMSANPIAMAAGLATVQKLIRDKPYEELDRRTQSFCRDLHKIFAHADVPVQIQQQGSLFWMNLPPHPASDQIRNPNKISSVQREKFSALFHELLKGGVYFSPSGYEVSFLSTVHGDEDLQPTLYAFEKALKNIRL